MLNVKNKNKSVQLKKAKYFILIIYVLYKLNYKNKKQKKICLQTTIKILNRLEIKKKKQSKSLKLQTSCRNIIPLHLC